jgi:hypothetical protein
MSPNGLSAANEQGKNARPVSKQIKPARSRCKAKELSNFEHIREFVSRRFFEALGLKGSSGWTCGDTWVSEVILYVCRLFACCGNEMQQELTIGFPKSHCCSFVDDLTPRPSPEAARGLWNNRCAYRQWESKEKVVVVL